MTIAAYFIGFLAGGITQAMVAGLNQPFGTGVLFSAIATLIGLLGVMALEKIKEATE